MLNVCDVAHNASLRELTSESRFPIQYTQNLKSSSVTRVRLTSKKGFVAVVCLFLFLFVCFFFFLFLGVAVVVVFCLFCLFVFCLFVVFMFLF